MDLINVAKEFSYKELISILGLCLSIGGTGAPLFFLIGIWFEKPYINCDPKGKPFHCSDVTACHKYPNNFEVDPEKSMHNLTFVHNLLCEREYISGTIVFSILFASLFGCIFVTIYTVNKAKRKAFLSFAQLFFFALVFASTFTEDLFWWTILFSISGMSDSVIFSNGSPYLSERLKPIHAKTMITFFLLARPTVGVAVAFIGPLFDSDTDKLSLIVGAFSLIGFFLFNAFDIRDDITKGEVNAENSFRGWEKLKPNFVFFIVYMIGCFFSNMLVSIELGNSFSSSVYTNILGVSIFEYFSVGMAGSVILRFSTESLLTFFLGSNIIICGSYAFYTESNLFFVAMLFVLKAMTDIMVVLNISMIAEFFPKYMMSKFISLAMFVSRTPTLFSGYIVTFCRHVLGIHPFLLTVIIYGFLFYYKRHIKKHEERKDSKEVELLIGH